MPTPDATTPTGPDQTPCALSPRERQVVELMALGFTNREIGGQLGISCNTVKTHLDRIYDKLDVTSRCQAGVWAARMGII